MSPTEAKLLLENKITVAIGAWERVSPNWAWQTKCVLDCLIGSDFGSIYDTTALDIDTFTSLLKFIAVYCYDPCGSTLLTSISVIGSLIVFSGGSIRGGLAQVAES